MTPTPTQSQIDELWKEYSGELKDSRTINKMLIRMWQKSQDECINNVLELLRLKCICRIRGLEVDIENKYPHEGRLDEYEELLRHLEELRWIIADVDYAEKYLSNKEKIRFGFLKQQLQSPQPQEKKDG